MRTKVLAILIACAALGACSVPVLANWSSKPGPVVPGWTSSGVRDQWGDDRVGFVRGNEDGPYTRHAALWRGVDQVFIDLHPSGYVSSDACEVYDGQQVGMGGISTGYTHALLWSGTADSCVDLHPDGFLGSVASGLDADEQVGWAISTSYKEHPMLWRGSGKSAVDLLPDGFAGGRANAICDLFQVGYVRTYLPGTYDSAALWNETAGSFVNLQSLVPSIYPWSQAYSVSVQGDDISVLGQVATTTNEYGEQDWKYYNYTWHLSKKDFQPVPEPSSMVALFSGLLGMGGLAFRRRK